MDGYMDGWMDGFPWISHHKSGFGSFKCCRLQHLARVCFVEKLRPKDKTALDDKRRTAVGSIFNRVIWAQRRSRVTSANYNAALLSRMLAAGRGKTGDTSSLPSGGSAIVLSPVPPPL